MFSDPNRTNWSSIIFLSLSSFVRLSSSLPHYDRRDSSFGITKPLYDTLELVEHFTAAAYCPGNTVGSKEKGKLVCPKSNNCPKVESAVTNIIVGISNAPLTDVTGFVATDATNNLTIISFQGTESAKQEKVDLNLNLMDFGHVCSGCTTHTGFWQSWNEAKPLVTQATLDSRSKFPNNRIIVTGHSLGGAIATLAAAELRSSGLPIDLYTFGAPRVGNQKLADYIQTPKEKLGENHRVTHYNDPVPRLPPAMMGYAHYTPEIYISSKNLKTVALTDMLFLNDSTTSKGNDQFTVVDVEAHRWYFNAISACYMANTPSNGTTSNDLATNWAGTIIGLMGNNSGMVLVGGKTASAANTAAASAMAGLIASMGTSAANSLLGMIPGGFLVQPFVPSAATTGGLTAAGTSGLLSSLGSLFGSATTKSGSKFIIESQS